eukprot:COSAG02_NODE_51929_length_311_cov_0.693396_1_plen_103_part_11
MCRAGFTGAPTTNEAATCTDTWYGENPCTDANGDGTADDAVNCGSGASCTVDGDSYTCTCDAGFGGAATTNEAATCTEMTCADANGDGTADDAADCGANAACT